MEKCLKQFGLISLSQAEKQNYIFPLGSFYSWGGKQKKKVFSYNCNISSE